MERTKEQFENDNNDLLNQLEVTKRNIDGAIIDGAFNPEEYYDSQIKILWILKEGYEEPFSYPETIRNKFEEIVWKELINGRSKPTWFPVALISHCILNGCLHFEEIENTDEYRAAIQSSLNKIALININKDPSITGTTSLHKNLQESFEYYRELILTQIKHLEPDIIICGNTFKYLEQDFQNPQVIKERDGELYVDHYIIDKKIILDPYHPGYTAFKLDAKWYINDVVRTVRDCRKKLSAVVAII